MNTPLRLLLVLMTLFTSAHASLVDLDAMAQDYVVEMKEIEVPGFSRALNPSIIRWEGKLLLCFRIRNPLTAVADGIGLVWLDEDFNPLSAPQVLHVTNPFHHPYPQDPKLVAVNHTLYLVYSDILSKGADGEFRRMFISELKNSRYGFKAEHPAMLLRFEGENPRKREKNWVPFNYMGNLLLAYSIAPHRIFLSVKDSSDISTLIATSKGNIKWTWGELRGGTPALLVDDRYLAFFHSSKAMKTVQSEGKNALHYFMGAYTFSSDPPFEITAISPAPIIGDTFYHAPEYPTWKPLRVVFPEDMCMMNSIFGSFTGAKTMKCGSSNLTEKNCCKASFP